MIIKKALALVFSLVLALSLVACGNKVDAKGLREDILKNVKFSSELANVETTVFTTIFGVELPENGNAMIYCGSSASADQFEIFEVDDQKDVAAVEESVKTMRDSLAETYKSYNTAELGKINNAVIRTKGNCVVMIITDDYKNAEKIVDKYFN